MTTVGNLNTMNFSQLVETLVLNNRKGVLYYKLIHEFGQNAATQLIKASLTGSRLLTMLLADNQTAGQMMKPPQPQAESAFQGSQGLEHYGYILNPYFSQPEYYHFIKDFQVILSILDFTTGFTPYDESEMPDPAEIPPGPNRCIGHMIQMPGRTFRGASG